MHLNYLGPTTIAAIHYRLHECQMQACPTGWGLGWTPRHGFCLKPKGMPEYRLLLWGRGMNSECGTNLLDELLTEITPYQTLCSPAMSSHLTIRWHILG